MQKLIEFLYEHLQNMTDDLINEYQEKLERYRGASAFEKENIKAQTQGNLALMLALFKNQEKNMDAFTAGLADLGERRARQGFPLDELLQTFHLAREVVYRYVRKGFKKYPDLQTKHLLEFDMVTGALFAQIDVAVVKPYLQFQENIIQTQQSFLKHKFSSLFKLVEAISNKLNIQEFCEILMDYLCRFYDVKVSAIFLMDESSRELYPQHATGLSRRFLREQRFSITGAPFKQCLDSGHVLVQDDTPFAADDLLVPIPTVETPVQAPVEKGRSKKGERPAPVAPARPAFSSVYAPIIGRQRIYGLVSIHSLEGRRYAQVELQQLETLARIAAVALENARFYDNLIEEKGKLDAIVNSISDGLILTNFHEEIVFINEQAARYLHIPVPKLVGASASLIPQHLLENAKDPQAIQAAYLRALMNIADHPILEFTLYRPDVTDLRVTMFPVKDRDQRFIGRGLIIEDVSREKEINRMKSEFVAIASHTMRTPMTSILGFASLLIERQLHPTIQNKYLQNIHRESQRLMAILNDMLDLANIEAGKMSLKLVPVDLAQLAGDISKELQEKNNREITLRLPVKLPKIIVDPEKLRQVFQNLVTNALKYADGPVQITVAQWHALKFKNGWQHSRTAAEAPGYFPAVAVSVEDQGEGIPADQMDEIFEPFHRVDSERTQKATGSGLGLTIARYIVEAHGGKIWVESKPGKGCCFTFILPQDLARPERVQGRLVS
ncbi:MAG: GAF domain-containing protein [Candidatus Firestonebacteria bacterium]|nr:GAF domain-containing protein [Candidatus Firestonebacteria bacterium]